jgi:hypothetical protein
VTRHAVRSRLEGRTVAVVGSGPSAVDHPDGFIDGHDIVVRVNNYKLTGGTGRRTDVFYSFFGTSIRKTPDELIGEGVTLCICKCPNAHAIESAWHRQNGKMHGVDFRWIYAHRASWWFCDTYVPTVEAFMAKFVTLGRHVPTTGFAAILDVIACHPAQLYLTGFDFFRSGLHNVDEAWGEKNGDDPIGHVPERELAWLAGNLASLPVACDPTLTQLLRSAARDAA